MTIKELIFSLGLAGLGTSALAVTYVDHGNVQYAGQIGFVSAGLGKKFFEHYDLGFMYGLVPGHLAGGAALETFTLRQTWGLFNVDWGRLYLGLSVFHVVGIRFETSTHREAPRGYYAIGSVRGLVNLGIAVRIPGWKSGSLYTEGGLNDIWIENAISNYPAVNPAKHTSLALGLKVDFN